MTRLLLPLLAALLCTTTLCTGQRLEFFVENGISIPLGNYANPDIYFEGGDGAGPGYTGQVGVNCYFDRYFGISVLGAIQSNPYATRKIKSLYHGLSEGRFRSIDLQGYLLTYGMIGPNIRFRQGMISSSFTPMVGYGYLDDNFVRFRIRNQVSENDIFLSRVSKNLGYTMGLKGTLGINLHEDLHIGVSVSYFRSAFNEMKKYLYYRDQQELENKTVIEKIEPQTINILFRLGLRI